MKNKAFTLIELLVVVLIIGILAAIAVPQYQVAVEKSRFSTLKEKTRAIAQAINMYYLANGQYPTKFEDLDISLGDIEHTEGLDLYFNNGELCYVWNPNQWDMVACSLKDDRMRYYYNYKTLKPSHCYAPLSNKVGLKVCEQEGTGSMSDHSDYGYKFFYY